MRVTCSPELEDLKQSDAGVRVLLYGRSKISTVGEGGASLFDALRKKKWSIDPVAFDFLSIALGVIAADFGVKRNTSPDGWTREFQLSVAVANPALWQPHARLLENALAFMTTDRWTIGFTKGGQRPPAHKKIVRPDANCVTLLSGGLDSLVGALDAGAAERRILAVSHVARGDKGTQRLFAEEILEVVKHVQFNHNVQVPGGEHPATQRSRSIIFLAYGIVAATATRVYKDGAKVPLIVNENGFIALNPPLTGGRVGSLSTRTTHPLLFGLLQRLFDAVGLRITLENPSRFKTKGEMLRDCKRQSPLKRLAAMATSCGRFSRYGFQHCGRCVPCLVRRASFLKWGVPDTTRYVFEHLSKKDANHRYFSDVADMATALRAIDLDGLPRWLGPSLSFANGDDRAAYVKMMERATKEMRAFLESAKVI